MSLFDIDDLINIKLYYMIKKTETNQQLVILEDTQAIKLLKDEEKTKEVEIIETKWKPLSWKEETNTMRSSLQKIDPISQNTNFDFYLYRDTIVKKCLVEWNLTKDGKSVPVTLENIDSLPALIILNLYSKFETTTNYDVTELKK